MKRKTTLFLILFHLIFSWALDAQTQTKVTSSNLNLRSDPNTSGQVITVVPKGTTVELKEDCDCEWILIQYKDKIGYVSSKYLVKPNNSNTSIKYYTNSEGERVQSPTKYSSVPAGATALCRDGTYSFSRNRRGTCSHHGGVARWY